MFVRRPKGFKTTLLRDQVGYMKMRRAWKHVAHILGKITVLQNIICCTFLTYSILMYPPPPRLQCYDQVDTATVSLHTAYSDCCQAKTVRMDTLDFIESIHHLRMIVD